MAENKYQFYKEKFTARLPLGESFDVLERSFTVAGRQGKMYFVDGLTDGDKVQLLLNFLLAEKNLQAPEAGTSAEEFIAVDYPFLDTLVTDNIETALKFLFSGLVPFILDGLDKIIIADARSYPARSIEEPQKEKTLRGAKDGFNETYMDSIALVRRRIRDPRLIFKNFTVGKISKTDVSLVYMKGIADNGLVERLSKKIEDLDVDALTVTDQSLVEALLPAKKLGHFNPFPRVRYTQRPDIVCAHLTEGKLAIIVDNTPTVLLLPVEIFDFFHDIDDYYFPVVTGNYFRTLRLLNMLVILFVSSIYLLLAEGDMVPPEGMEFIVPKKEFAIPIFWQFILLELAIDGLKLASLNTPESLGMSLSVIGALILGEFSVDSGWFIPQTILVMAVVALATFTQPSIELSYGVKFLRIMSLVLCHIIGPWELAVSVALMLLIIATTKTISGHSYLYPLLPFNWSLLKKLLFRTTK